MATQTQMISRLCQEARSTENVKHKLSSHAFVSRRTCSRLVNNSSTRCASVSSLSLVVGRQTTAFVESSDYAERCPLTSSLHFLQSSETAQPIDAGLVQSHAAESQSVGCSLEQLQGNRIPVFILQISCLECGQELVDPLKPALIHENRPIADSCLGRHSSFGSCDHDRPTWEKWHKRWDKISDSQYQRL